MNKNIFSLVTLVLALLLTFGASNVWAATTITVQFNNGSGNPINSGATLRYNDGIWHTDAVDNGNGTFTINTSAASLYYEMTYNYGVQQIGPISSATTTVTFRTTSTTVHLQTSGGGGLSGGIARYNQGAWHNLGSTDGSGNTTVIELLPGSYYFDMDYNHGHQQLGPLAISGSDPHAQTVTFTTTATTVRLETSLHVGLDGAATHYNQGAWWDIGTTAGGGNAPLIQLLPGSYYFDVAYNNGKQQVGPLAVSGSAQTVNFQTTKVTVRLANCSNTGFAGGVAGYNQGAWNALPNTDASGNTFIELLPGSWYFNMVYNFGTQQLGPLAVSGNAQTILFQTTAVTMVGSGLKEYNQGAWHTFPGTIDLLPGSYYFRIGGSQVGPYAVSGCTFYRAFITVELRNGAGSFITSGASLRYHDGSWKTNAVDNHDGTFSVIATAASLYYEMTYNHGIQQIGPIPGSTNLVTFRTTTTTVRLENSTHTGFSGGVARYNQGAWYSFGTTGVSGDTPAMELLPGSYYFDMVYNSGKQQIGPLAILSDPHAQTVLFQTTTTTVRLLSGGGGGGLDGGAARFNQGTWNAFGTTGDGGTGLTGVKELLPGSYYFDMVFNNGRQQIGPTPIAGLTQTVTFTTTSTTVRLLSGGGGGGLDGGAARFNQGTWNAFGTTGDGGTGLTGVKELLPGSYYFDMVFNNGRQQIGPTPIAGLTQTVTFTTTSTTVRLLSGGGGGGLDGGAARFNQGTWNAFGTTGDGGTGLTGVKELLPGSYYFDMLYNNGRQQIGPTGIAGLTQTVTFTTTTTTVRLENCSHTGFSGGIARYNQGAWYSFGTTVASGNTPSVELLPGSYYFDMDYNYGRQQLGPLAVAGGTQTVLFQTTTVAIGGTGVKEYNQGAWHTLTSPIDLLPGSYYFRVAGIQVGPVGVSGCTFDKTIVTISLKNHLNAPLAGGFAQWHNGSAWVDIGTTPVSGQLVAFVNTNNVYYNMKYNNATQQVGPFAAQDYIFKTTEVSLNLKDHSNNLITAVDAGTAKYYSPTTSTWYTLGTTGSVGYYKIELLPVSGYWFSMRYNNVEKQTGAMAVGAGPTQDVDFKTTEVSLNLKDHSNNLITAVDAGTAKYYSPTTSTWYTLGTTGSVGYYKIELLPVSGYWFSMRYNNVEKQTGAMAVGAGPTQDVDFKTTEVSLNLKDHNGALITDLDAGTAKYYSPTTTTWYTVGTTGTDGYYRLELLPVNGYWFGMVYAYVEKQIGAMAVGVGPTQDVDFQTGLLTVKLQDASSIPISGGLASYHDGSVWHDIGSTDGAGMISRELLPRSYYVGMTYSSQTKQHYPVVVSAGGAVTTTFTWDGTILLKPGETVPEFPLAAEIPNQFGLHQNYPNPFNPTTTITYALPVDANVNLQVYDISGRSVAQLVEGRVNAGYHSVVFNASGVASGLYFYRMTAKGDDGTNFTLTQKMVLVK